MFSIIRCFQAEWLKSRHTPLLLVHVLFPLIGAGVFAGYFHISGWSEMTNVTTFLEVLAIIFPFVYGVRCRYDSRTRKWSRSFSVNLRYDPFTYSGIYRKISISYRFSNLCNNTLYFLVCRTLSSYAIFVLYKTSYYVDIVCNTTLSYFHTCWFQFRQKCIYVHRYCRKFIICIASYRTLEILSGNSCRGAGVYDLMDYCVLR